MNSFGRIFKVSIFGESHGDCVGVLLDGVPAGIPLSEADFESDMARRRGGQGLGTTPRKEADTPMLKSGVYEGHTTGAPLLIEFANSNTRSGDYAGFVDTPRPGHADFTGAVKFGGFNDPRGGGHFSGRLTAAVVAAGVVAKKIVGEEVSFSAKIVELGGREDGWDEALRSAAAEGDSLGAVVQLTVDGLGAGFGEPFFDSIESLMGHAFFAIPGVRGVEFGDGFAAAAMKGSEHNDVFGEDGLPASNHAGGVNGGISNGAPIVCRVAFKPTASIAKAQKTLNFATGKMEELEIGGRHDVCFALRTPVILEAMAAIVLADLMSYE